TSTHIHRLPLLSHFFFSTSPAPTKIYPLSLHDALPICTAVRDYTHVMDLAEAHVAALRRMLKSQENAAINLGTGSGHSVRQVDGDRKSTRLNSSHRTISYAVFCLKKKKKTLNMLISNVN